MKWTEDEIEFLKACLDSGWTHQEIAEETEGKRTLISIRSITSKLHIKSKNKKAYSNIEIDNKIQNKGIKRLEDYKNNFTKYKFKCLICNTIWETTIHIILSGNQGLPCGCPSCANHGFNSSSPAITYCIYFPDIDLYKVGITNNLTNRLKQFGQKATVIFTREFDLGIDAKELETKWLDNIKDYKVNTGLLKSGNTETLRI